MSKKSFKKFQPVYSQIQEIDNNVVLFDTKGAPSVVIKIRNPVLKLSTDSEQYLQFHDVLSNIVHTLGEGYALQKQDIFCRQKYHHTVENDADFLTKSYFRYFDGREYTAITSYLIITQEPLRSHFVKFDPKSWHDFLTKIQKVKDILKDRNIDFTVPNYNEVLDYVHRFTAFDFKPGAYSLSNFKASKTKVDFGDRIVKSYQLVDIDVINLPSVVKPFMESHVNGYPIALDLLSFLSEIPNTDCVVYNQVMQIPAQRKLMAKLQGKSRRHGSMPDPSNKIAKADIDEVLDLLAVESCLLVNTNLNILVSCKADNATEVG